MLHPELHTLGWCSVCRTAGGQEWGHHDTPLTSANDLQHLSLISFSKVHSTIHMLVTTSIIIQQSILPIRPSALFQKSLFEVLVSKWIPELFFSSAMHTLSRQHAYLTSQLCTYCQGNILTWLLSHAHTIKITYLPGFSAKDSSL